MNRSLRKSPSRTAALAKRSLSPSRSKSPSRKKSPSRARSPGRKKSPLRTKSPVKTRTSPSRTKSPSRKKATVNRKSPTPSPPAKASPPPRRASPARVSASPFLQRALSKEKSPFINVVDILKEKKMIPAKDTEVLTKDFKETIIEEEIRRVSAEPEQRNASKIISTSVMSASSTVLRRSARTVNRDTGIKLKEEVEKDVEKILKANNVPLPYDFNKQLLPSTVGNLQFKREFGGIPGVLFFMLLLPVSCFTILISCSEKNCSPLESIKSYNLNKVYFDKKAVAVYLGLLIIQIILSILPIGKRLNVPAKYGSLEFRCNGWLNGLITLGIVSGLYFYGYTVMCIFDKLIPFAVTAFICGLLLSFALFFKGRKPRFANSFTDGNPIYDFWAGREVSPRIGPFNVQHALLQILYACCLIHNVLVIVKSYEENKFENLTILVTTSLQMIYLLDYYIFEARYFSSFEMSQEGAGYMIVVGYLLWPFVLTGIPRYLLFTKKEVPLYILGISVVVFLIGYIIFFRSNSQKHLLRTDPLNPALASLDKIPTAQGKKLLCGGLWGWVRHPNYVGDILMSWGWAIPCGYSHWMPLVVPVCTTFLLIHRARRDNDRCKLRYGSSWERYTQKVKYYLLPRVY